MKAYLSKLCQELNPYVAGEQPQDRKYIKLNTNENPYPPCDGVKGILNNYNADKLKKYPDPNNISLRSAIADKYNQGVENIFVGNGSDEVLAMCFPTFADKSVAFADITYSFYPVYCEMFNKKSKLIPLREDFSYDIDKYKNIAADMVIITNPNAPTTLAIGRLSLIEIIESNRDKVVLVDEAYSAFMGWSAVDLTSIYDNLLVVKTFSKAYSLAGARCGYAIGNAELINGLNAVKNSFNSYTVNSITELLAREAILDDEYYNYTVNKIIHTREKTYRQMIELGFEMPVSSANFLFAKHEYISAKVLYNKLKCNGVLVRYFDKPRIDNYLRITIGSDEEMDDFISILKGIINE